MINRLTASLIIFALLCSSCEEKGQELGDAKISTDGNTGTLAATDLSALTTFTFIKSYFDISADSNVTNSSIVTVSGTLSGTATSTAFNYYDDWDNSGHLPLHSHIRRMATLLFLHFQPIPRQPRLKALLQLALLHLLLILI